MGHAVRNRKAQATSEDRARHVANALATVRMEGAEPHPEVLSLAERYIKGELTLEESGSRIEALFIL
jgi:hypothetical protein